MKRTTGPERTDRELLAARWLVAEHRDRAPFAAFPAGFAPATLEQAYAVQDRFVKIKSQACGPIVGWKIALSNPAMQELVGIPEPIAGCLLQRQVVAGPARARAADYRHLLVEFEIAVELGEDLPARFGSHTRESVAHAVVAVRPAFELADDRGADYAALAAHGMQLVADNAWNEGAVLGQRRTDWATLDLVGIRGVVTIDGVEVGVGHGRDLMGNPFDALAWLANCLSRRGIAMRAGQVAILGSLVTSKFPVAGQRLEFALDGFETLTLGIE